jgi:STE24 endopeptidase
MQLAILLVVVCAVSGSAAGAHPTGGELWQLFAALALLLAAPLTAMIARTSLAAALHTDRIDAGVAHKRWEAWHEVVTWVWAGSALVVLYVGRWPQAVRSAEFTLAWPLVDELLILMPLVSSLLVVWIACHRVERLLQQAAGEAAVSLWTYASLRIRHHLGLTLLPALVILGIQESAVHFHWISGAEDHRAWWLWGVLLVAAALGLPLVLRWLWQTERVADSPLKQRLMASCRALGCGVKDIVVWKTGGTLANAAVAGLLPGMRTIFLSDGLIARLSDDELDVVVRHEAAHLSRRHLWQRLMLLGLPVLVYFAVQTQWPQGIAAFGELLASVGIAPVWQMSLVMPLAVLGYALAMLGWLARMHEHDADLAACCGAAQGVAIDAGAVAHLHAALFKLVGDSDEYHRGRWLHPSVLKRVAFLGAASDQPLLAARFRGRLFWVSCCLLLLCGVAIAAGLWPA